MSPNKIKELRAHTARLIKQAAELQEKNRLLGEESAQIMAELAANKAELHDARETISRLLSKYNKSYKLFLFNIILVVGGTASIAF